jgi:exonuclease VII large subunit
VYVQRGSLSLIVEELHPEGIGELQLAFEQLNSFWSDVARATMTG